MLVRVRWESPMVNLFVSARWRLQVGLISEPVALADVNERTSSLIHKALANML